MIGARWQAGAALGVALLALAALPALPDGESERDRITARTVDLELPSQAYAEESYDELAVTVTASGYTIDGEELDDLGVIARFADVARRAPSTTVMVSAASDVPYDRVVELLDRARTAGLDKIAFTATEP